MANNPRKSVPIKSVGTMLELLMEIQERNGAGVSELAASLDVAKSTVHNHLSTLRKYEYVVREDDEYRIGIRFLDHGGHARAHLSGQTLIRQKAQEVAEQTGELVQYLVEEHGRGVFVFRESGDKAVRTEARLGRRVYLHQVSAGKAMLAHMPDDRREWILDRHGLPPKTDKTITDRQALLDNLETIRKQGYVFDEEEHIKGLCSIGVPVGIGDHELLGAMSLAGPPHRILDEEKREEIVQLLRGVANEIELNLTY